MARKPDNFEWLGFSAERLRLLDFIDVIGNNGWARNSHSEELVPRKLTEWAATGATIDDLVAAMRAIGYYPENLHQLRRWESRRVTGRFGP